MHIFTNFTYHMYYVHNSEGRILYLHICDQHYSILKGIDFGVSAIWPDFDHLEVAFHQIHQ